MSVVIIMGLACLFIIFLVLRLNPGEKKEAKQGQPQKATSTQEVVYKIPRDRLLRLLGWENSPRKHFIGEYSLKVDILKGYRHIPIVGTFYREDVTLLDIGWFNGYAAIEPNNPYDSSAIAIYRDDHKQIGYLPKGNLQMFKYIKAQGGKVHAYGVLAYDCWSDSWYGYAIIEDDCSLVKCRNAKFEQKNITFYEPAVDITEYLNNMQQNKA